MKTLTDVKRFNMIEQQIRTWDVFDASILDLYDKIKREAYVPETYKKIAFTDVQIPLQHKQYMLAPKQEARVLQSLNVKTNRSYFTYWDRDGFFCSFASFSFKACRYDGFI
jgi:protein-L-isoaspartate(D-aspartate) O-methyltransferase